MALDSALITAFVNTAVGCFIGAVPSAGPAALGVIGAVHGAIVGLARHAVGIAGVDARIGIGGAAIVERRLFGARIAPHQHKPPGPPQQHQRSPHLSPFSPAPNNSKARCWGTLLS